MPRTRSLGSGSLVCGFALVNVVPSLSDDVTT